VAGRGLGFRNTHGEATNHSTDYHRWKALLRKAGLRESRLHDARHMAATVLLILRQPERTVMSLMGWSSADMTKRYQHVTDSIRADVAGQVVTSSGRPATRPRVSSPSWFGGTLWPRSAPWWRPRSSGKGSTT